MILAKRKETVAVSVCSLSSDDESTSAENPQAVNALVHELIEIHAEQAPDSAAIVSWDGELSYGELRRHSSRLAAELMVRGVGPETVVPICLEKSLWSVVSMIAVLKAGGAFVALDVSQPVARLQSIVRQTGAKLALSSPACLNICQGIIGSDGEDDEHNEKMEIFMVDEASLTSVTTEEPHSPESPSSPPCAAKPNNAAYLIFTSGSTGTPKGVIIEHSQLSTGAMNLGQRLCFSDRPCRMLQFASYAFDACILEIFVTLVSGGSVCIPSEWERKNGIVSAMRRMAVTHAFFTPTLLHSLDLSADDVPSLTTLMVGGEAVPNSLVEKWAQRVHFFLVYGPTECTVICLALGVSHCDIKSIVSGELGTPVGCRCWIVRQDDTDQLAEAGQIGELLVEGPILARGYLNDVAKTEKAFLQNPSWLPGPARVYRTGDLAYYLEDGSISYAGRIDSQVKVRGQRLELAEVEKHLHDALFSVQIENVSILPTSHIMVEAMKLSGSASSQLVAFLCLKTAGPCQLGCFQWENQHDEALQTCPEERAHFSALVDQLVGRMKSALPIYAVPSVFIPLRNVPFSAGGKTDRKSLRSAAANFSVKELLTFCTLTSTLAEELSGTREPMTEKEEWLQKLWAQVLDIEKDEINSQDSFLSLGGDSILAIKLVNAARASGLDLTFSTVIKHAVLSDMALHAAPMAAGPGDEDYGDEIAPFALLEGDSSAYIQQASAQCAVVESKIQDIYLCSGLQAGMLASSFRDPGAYMMQLTYSLPESTDPDKLRNAWATVVARTPALRTRFIEFDQGRTSSLLQVVVDEPLRWLVQRGDLDQVLVKEKARRCDLGGPLSFFTLVVDENSLTSTLVWTIHHSLTDGWSVSLITSDVEQEYFGESVTTSLEPPAPDFHHFIQHVQRQRHDESARRFWSQTLDDAPTPSFPAMPSDTYVPHATSVLQHQVSSFDAKATTTNATTAATLVQAAWSLLLAIYTGGSDDIITGMTLSGRTAALAGIHRIAGPTITTVPFRISSPSPDQTLAEYIRSVQDQYLAILPYEQFGLDNIRRLGAGAEAACRFRSLLVVQAANDFESSRRLLRDQQHSFSSLDCALMMECEFLQDGSILLRATFDCHVLSNAQVQRIFSQMQHLLTRLAHDDPFTTKVSELQTASEADVQQILEWNQHDWKTATVCVHDLVQRHVHDTPTAPAICAWDGSLSFEELDLLSLKLASHLQHVYHIGPESLVPVCFEKSMWTVVAMLSVLRAGGACVPMDPKNPVGRLQTILAALGDKSAGLLLTSAPQAERLAAELPETHVLAVDQTWFRSLVGGRPVDEPMATADNAAFVVFTSGSTGNPKGIVIPHSAFCSSALAHGSFQHQELGEQPRVLQFAAHTFDISIGDMFATLIHGGCICIPNEHDRMNDLAGAINALRANYVSLTATVAASLHPQDVPSLKTLVSAGEAMSRSVIEKWADRVNLINLYGPAECTVYCIGRARITKQDHASNIGTGIGATVWIVDPNDHNCLAPIGGIGELLIGGPNVARGYLGDDEKTSNSFIQDPAFIKALGRGKNQRFYKTGDLASYNADGTIAFVGRNDGQTKLRGQRLEIGEVEYQLQQALGPLAKVAVAAVAPSDSNGDKILAAFIVLKQESDDLIANSPSDLDSFRSLVKDAEVKLQAILPSYMVPSAYVPIRRLPLSASGKVDRKRLQRLAASLSRRQLSEFLAGQEKNKEQDKVVRSPVTHKEKTLQSLWETLLGSDVEIGLDDHFFHAGGDSMTAMSLVSLSRKQGLTLTVDGIFKNPILRDMASTAKEQMDQNLANTVAPFSLLSGVGDVEDLRKQAVQQCRIRPEQIQDIYPVTAVQERFMRGAYLGGAERSAPGERGRDDQGQMIFYLPQNIDLERFRQAWRTVARRHDALRTRIIDTPSGTFQVVVDEDVMWTAWSCPIDEFMQKDRLDCMVFGDRLLRLAIIEPQKGEGGADEERFFGFNMLHAVYDGFSLGLLFREVESAYHNSASSAVATAPPPAQMNQLIKQLMVGDREAALKFWAAELKDADVKPIRTIGGAPYDRLDRRILNKSRKRVSVDVPTDLHGIMLSTTIQVAAGLMLAHELGCPDIIFEGLLSGRNGAVPGIEELVGPAIICLPIRIRIGGGNGKKSTRSVLEVLRETQRLLHTEVAPHEHVGWWDLVHMDDFRDQLRSVPQINVNPNSFLALGSGLGLTQKESWSANEIYYAMSSMLTDDGKMVLVISTDYAYVPEQDLDRQLAKWASFLSKVVHLCQTQTDITVGEFFDGWEG